MTGRSPLGLSLTSVSVHYGLTTALDAVTINVTSGGVMAIIGANGAGKSTLLKVIAGIVSASAGTVRIGDHEITDWGPRRVAELGVATVPEGRRVFRSLSVEENLEVGSYLRRAGMRTRMGQIYGLFPALEQRKKQVAGTLSGGEQQMLSIGRALMLDPGLLLLDEPSLGLAPVIVRSVFTSLEEIHRETGITIVLIEQNAREALRLVDRAVVLENGRVALTGSTEELLAGQRIEEAYFGAE